LDPKDSPQNVLDLTAIGDPPAPLDRLVAVLGDVSEPDPGDPHPCQGYAVVVSPDGRLAATAGRSDRTVRVWELATGRLRHTLSGHPSRVYTLAFSADGKTLASGDQKGTAVKLWDVDRGTERSSLIPIGPLYQIALSPDGKLLATAGPGQPVVVWEVSTGRIRHSLRVGTTFASAVAFSPDGAWLAGGNYGGQVLVWDAATGDERVQLSGHEMEVRWLGFHPGGRSLAVASARRGVTSPVFLWDLTTREVRHRLDAPTAGVICGAWRADGRVLFLAGAVDGNVRAWDLTGEAPRSADLSVLRPGLEWLSGIALTPEGRHLLVTHPKGPTLVFRLAPRGTPFAVPTK
jgi:WD40 repeat protein